MKRLQFVPKAQALPRFPNKGAGSMPYVGRVFVPSDKPGIRGEYVATKEPASVVAGTPEAARLIEICKRDGDVLPADEETAKAIGVRYVPLSYDSSDREWKPAPDKPEASAPSPKRSQVSRKADD